LFEGRMRVRYVDGETAARYLGWTGLTYPAAALVGVCKQVVLAPTRHGETRFELPAQHFGTPCLGGRRVAARELGVRDPAVKAACRHVSRRGRPPLGRSLCRPSGLLGHVLSGAF